MQILSHGIKHDCKKLIQHAIPHLARRPLTKIAEILPNRFILAWVREMPCQIVRTKGIYRFPDSLSPGIRDGLRFSAHVHSLSQGCFSKHWFTSRIKLYKVVATTSLSCVYC